MTYLTGKNSQEFVFEDVFARRVMDTPRSFIREILGIAIAPGMISFAGGLPNKDLFPVEELREACDKVFSLYAPDVLQYSNTEGLLELREYISRHYAERGVAQISPENILITSGSQQAMDLLAKVFINEGDRVVLEEPSYLGAIQAFSLFRPQFITIPISEAGMDVEELKHAFLQSVKLMYVVPNFQNPTGISYPEENRRAIAEILRGTKTFLVEDDPYGELRFSGHPNTSFMNLIPEHTILLGTFSKTVVPAFRIGWVVAPKPVIEKLVIAKQAADLHTNSFSQYALYQYLISNDPAKHISRIVKQYGAQKQAMVKAISRHFPESVKYTNPEGGMFLWATLPDNISSLKLFEIAVEDGVCIVPGHPFYIGKHDVSTMRLNFSCMDEAMIEEGIKRLGKAVYQLYPGT
ncbi:MAG: PLP-dependent aminotransferase family protein [Syntrophothermus sp.]